MGEMIETESYVFRNEKWLNNRCRCPHGIVCLLCVIAALGLLFSALADDLPRFEVASVKLSDPMHKKSDINVCTGGPGTSDPGMLRCRNSSLSMYISIAYDVRWYQLIAPDWVMQGGADSTYDITAKLPLGTSKEEYRLMMQQLLADRFHVGVHRENRDLPVYSLVLGTGKPKMVPSSSPEPPSQRCRMFLVKNRFSWDCRNTLLKDLARDLEGQLFSSVADERGFQDRTTLR